MCTLEDTWEQLLSLQLKCGKTFERKVRRKIGVVREHIEDFEATLKGSLGFKGIAEVESLVKAATATSVKFEEMQEVEESITINAPEYGRHVCCFFQKKQIYDFEIREYGFFRDIPRHFRIERWLDEYRDDSRRYEYDPDCGGTMRPTSQPDGVIDLVLKGGNLTVSAPYRISETGVEFMNLGLRTDEDPTTLTFKRTRLSSEMLSEAARLFAGITETHVDAIFFPRLTNYSESAVRGLIPSVRLGAKAGPTKGVTIAGRLPLHAISKSEDLFVEPLSYQNVREVWRGMKAFPLVNLKKI